eukprot:Blabericola_migrator_1__6991@NODE_3543_length_1691_cov_142_506773_g1368_i4_p2_GENE_NODE_3543_length_1691_cov_142_506773_g1368_i4NODE_3543_length_1691_cov_142_506773_g1368_i4_p2_ORF_typecomplete_len171_score0_65_NODE_3543_length_1691_cov_142_506773_g1368_i49691481
MSTLSGIVLQTSETETGIAVLVHCRLVCLTWKRCQYTKPVGLLALQRSFLGWPHYAKNALYSPWNVHTIVTHGKSVLAWIPLPHVCAMRLLNFAICSMTSAAMRRPHSEKLLLQSGPYDLSSSQERLGHYAPLVSFEYGVLEPGELISEPQDRKHTSNELVSNIQRLCDL